MAYQTSFKRPILDNKADKIEMETFMDNYTTPSQNGSKKTRQMIIIAGAGQAGYQLTRILLKKGIETVLIERDMARYKALVHDIGASSVRRGDACDSSFLLNNGINRATMVFGLTGDDEDNFMFCKLAKMLGNKPVTISRLNNLDNSEFFRKNIDRIVSLTRDVRDILGFESCFQSTQNVESPNPQARYQPYFLNVTTEAGQTVSNVEKSLNSQAILLYRQSDNFQPKADDILQPSDHILMLKDTHEEIAELSYPISIAETFTESNPIHHSDPDPDKVSTN